MIRRQPITRRLPYDIIARPDLCYFNGATKYVLYEADYGNTLDLNKITTIEEFLHTMYKLACALEKLHSYGLIYMDLKPENILISGNGSVKLIDLDAVIDIKDLQNVHLSKGDIRFDMTDPSLIAPEIRPEMLGEFEQNKYFLLTNRVDIYSFGAIMLKWFLGRYPTENDCTAREFEQEILAMFRTGKLRGKLTQDEQTSLIEILWRCIQENTSPDGRYLETGELVKNLDSLQKLVSVSVSMRRQKYDRVRGRVQAAYVMDRFPLCDYCVRTGENEWVMDALIIGNDPISEDFFSNTLACAQMLDTKLVIRIAAGAAKELLKDYLNRWPLFSRTCILYLEDQLYGSGDGKDCGGIDQEITSVPFAEVRFYEWDQQKDPVGFISGMEKHDQISEKTISLQEKSLIFYSLKTKDALSAIWMSAVMDLNSENPVEQGRGLLFLLSMPIKHGQWRRSNLKRELTEKLSFCINFIHASGMSVPVRRSFGIHLRKPIM